MDQKEVMVIIMLSEGNCHQSFQGSQTRGTETMATKHRDQSISVPITCVCAIGTKVCHWRLNVSWVRGWNDRSRNIVCVIVFVPIFRCISSTALLSKKSFQIFSNANHITWPRASVRSFVYSFTFEQGWHKLQAQSPRAPYETRGYRC